MAEYIDREEAKNLLELALEDDWEVRYAEDRLNEIPAADVAPVVRCTDCKYAHMTYDGECKYCDIWFPDEKVYVDGDYYCASAERKES